MRLSQLQQLVCLSQTGSFTKAAQALFISQPALSTSIRELEEELGQQLIFRSNRGILFTPLGLKVLEHARQVLDEVAQIQELCAEDAFSGEFSMASTPHYCATLLVQAKLCIERSHPALVVSLEESDSASILQDVLEGSVDAGIIQLCDLEEEKLWEHVRSGELQYQELFEEELCVTVPEGHPLLPAAPIAPEALLDYPYGSFRQAMNQWVAGLFQQHPNPPQIFRIKDTVPLRILLAQAQAFTVIPVRAINHGNALYRDKLVPLPVEGITLSSKVGIICKRGRGERLMDRLTVLLRDICGGYQNSNT